MRHKGIKVETSRGIDCEASAEAPAGLQFKSTGTTMVVCGLIGNSAATLRLCVDSVCKDIDDGFEPDTGESYEADGEVKP